MSWVAILFYVIVTAYSGWSDMIHPSFLNTALVILGPLGILIAVFPMSSRRIAVKLFGEFKYIEISDATIQERVRTRFQKEISELEARTFKLQFFAGQAFPAWRVVMILPAIVLMMMRWKREPLLFEKRRQFVVVNPVLLSSDHLTYAQLLGPGLLLHTTFQSGLHISTTNYGEAFSQGQFVRYVLKRGSIAETLDFHQRAVHERQANGDAITMGIGFQAYLNIAG